MNLVNMYNNTKYRIIRIKDLRIGDQVRVVHDDRIRRIWGFINGDVLTIHSMQACSPGCTAKNAIPCGRYLLLIKTRSGHEASVCTKEVETISGLKIIE